jgi:hypothetical protein
MYKAQRAQTETGAYFIVIIIIIIIILYAGIYNYVPQTNHVSNVYIVAAIV